MRSRLPVLRARRRYLAFRLVSEEVVQAKDLMAEIQFRQISLFGDAMASENRLKLISFADQTGLLRIHHLHIEETRAILASVYSIKGVRVALHSIGVSGTIKSAREKYLPKLVKISYDSDGRRIELEEISGCIIRTRGLEVDLCPDDRNKTIGSDTRYLGLTSFDL